MRQLINRIIPFIMLGIALVALAFGIFVLAYLFFFGAIVGLVLFAINWIRNRFFRPKTITRSQQKRGGRTIDSDDWKVL